MTRIINTQKIAKTLLIVLCVFSISSAVFGQSASGPELQRLEVMPGGPPVRLIAIPEDNNFRLLPPAGAQLVNQPTATFQINYLSGGTNWFNPMGQTSVAGA